MLRVMMCWDYVATGLKNEKCQNKPLHLCLRRARKGAVPEKPKITIGAWLGYSSLGRVREGTDDLLAICREVETRHKTNRSRSDEPRKSRIRQNDRTSESDYSDNFSK